MGLRLLHSHSSCDSSLTAKPALVFLSGEGSFQKPAQVEFLPALPACKDWNDLRTTKMFAPQLEEKRLNIRVYSINQ